MLIDFKTSQYLSAIFAPQNPQSINMKIKSFLFALFALFFSIHTQAQAWEKSSKVIGVGFGASSFFHVNAAGKKYYNGAYSPVTGQINLQMEFGIHDYVGLGFQTGFGGGGPVAGRGWRGRWYWYDGYYNGSINLPIAIFANFHFYQLIADKTGKDIHADKLDIYGGINLGTGVGFLFYDDGTLVTPLAFGGFHAGVRYFFTEKFGANLEVGYGKQIVNGGLVFKLN